MHVLSMINKMSMGERAKTRLRENDIFLWKNRKKNKAAHTFTEGDKQIHRSPGCVWRGEPHGPHVLPLHISIFIDPFKTQRHQKHHISGLQHTFTHAHIHTTHTCISRDMQTYTHERKKRHLLCKPQCLLRAKLERLRGNNSRLNHHPRLWPRKKNKKLPAWKKNCGYKR